MNDNRSPIWDNNKFYLIGIILLGTMIALFILNLILNINSEVLADDSISTQADATITDATETDTDVVEEIPVATSIVNSNKKITKSGVYYIPSEVSESLRKQRMKKYIESESYLPSSAAEAKRKMEEYEAKKEEERRQAAKAKKQQQDATPVATVSYDTATSTDASSSSGQFLGTYELTAYIATGNPCASGVYPTVGRTVACNSIPLGTTIYIEGYGTYVVEDTGGMGGGVIDVFVGSYDEAIQFGRRSANVYLQ